MAGPRLAAVDAALGGLVEAKEYAGITALAVQGGRLVHEAAYGVRDLATGAPMEVDTVVRAFSMTKPVTAVAMMILHDQGLWRPEDPIARFIPEFADLKVFEGPAEDGSPRLRPPRAPPTMAQLMTHTAGFSYGADVGFVDDGYRAADLWTTAGADDFVRRVAAIPLAYEPGEAWLYSIAMDLQGVIVERLSGLSLGAFMDRHIFAPLGMSDTAFFCPPAKRQRLAALYQWKEGGLRPVRNPPLTGEGASEPAFASGGGGLFSTAPDYMRFARMLLGDGALDGVRIISSEAARQMMTSQLPPGFIARGWGVGFQQLRPGYAYGYNGVVVTDPAAAGVALGLGTYLWDGYASTWFWVDPEHDVAFVGMVQRLAGPEAPLIQPISQKAVAEALGFG